MVANKVRLVCGECRWKVTGTRGDSNRRGCERCGGQLRELSMSHSGARRKRHG